MKVYITPVNFSHSWSPENEAQWLWWWTLPQALQAGYLVKCLLNTLPWGWFILASVTKPFWHPNVQIVIYPVLLFTSKKRLIHQPHVSMWTYQILHRPYANALDVVCIVHIIWFPSLFTVTCAPVFWTDSLLMLQPVSNYRPILAMYLNECF